MEQEHHQRPNCSRRRTARQQRLAGLLPSLLLLCACPARAAITAVRAPGQLSGVLTAQPGAQGGLPAPGSPQVLLLQRPSLGGAPTVAGAAAVPATAAAAAVSTRAGVEQRAAAAAAAAAGATSTTTTGTSSSRRHLSQFGPMMMPGGGDLLTLDSILAAARDAFGFFEPAASSLGPSGSGGINSYPGPARRARQQQQQRQQQQRSALPGVVLLQVSFVTTAADQVVPPRLPAAPRAFNLTVRSSDGHVAACSAARLAYADQAVPCAGLTADGTTLWNATLTDADADDVVLRTLSFTLPPGATSQDVPVALGPLSVEAAFGELAWAGTYSAARPQHKAATIVIHAQIVGAQVKVFTQQGGTPVLWDTQWTGDDGTAEFYLVPGARNTFFANMSVGDVVLKSAPLLLDDSLGSSPSLPAAAAAAAQDPLAAQLQQLVAAPQLLCTGEVEDVRGDAGTFPQSLAGLEAAGQSIFHPKGFVCRWELIPEQPDVLLSIDYRGLLPDETITLVLGPSNIVQLTRPADTPGAVYQASLWIESSILVAFQTTRSSTSKVGTFSVSWTSVSSANRGVLNSKTMVIVLSCVSAAGALLAACCFYFVCCGRLRRRSGAAVVDGASAVAPEVSLLRVPSAVRELLPHKPYQVPEAANPLPGAVTEPDCCSVCLAEFEQGEQVTVLPCLHFYHKDCIGSWLKRNCTCPLCKSNVLEAFKVQQLEARHVERRRRRNLHLFGVTSPPAAMYRGEEPPAAAGGGAEAGEAGHHHQQQQQQIELTAVLPASPFAAAAAASTGAPVWVPLDGGRAPSPAAADGVQRARSPSSSPSSRRSSSGGSATADVTVIAFTPPPRGLAVPALTIPPSPFMAASAQNGTVDATSLDFAPAAAAAAAVMAQHQQQLWQQQQQQRSPLASPGAFAGAAVAAAQASIAALRTSSRTLSRRLSQGLAGGLASPTTLSRAASPVGGDEEAPPPPPAASPAAPATGTQRAGSLGLMAPRVVSIYVHAGHPAQLGSDAGSRPQQVQAGALPGSVDEPQQQP